MNEKAQQHYNMTRCIQMVRYPAETHYRRIYMEMCRFKSNKLSSFKFGISHISYLP